MLLPDVRIEYDTASGERSKVNLELTTDHYHAGQLAAKARAGFTLYSASGTLAGAWPRSEAAWRPVVRPPLSSGLLSL